MKQIILYSGLVAIVDDDDYQRLVNYRWFKTTGNRCHTYYAATKIDGKNVKMHRLILGTLPGTVVDHIDGDGLNNQKHNLRECSNTCNSRNAKKHKTSTHSKYKGVCRCKDRPGKWQAGIGVDRRRIPLGRYDTEEAAAKAYNAAAVEYYGPFASLNVI